MILLLRIEKHLRERGTPPSRFGREALGDPALVSDLRSGREPREATIRRLIQYLERVETSKPQAEP